MLSNIAARHGLAVARSHSEKPEALSTNVVNALTLHLAEFLIEAFEDSDLRSTLWEIGIHSANPLLSTDVGELMETSFCAGVEMRELDDSTANDYHPMKYDNVFIISKYKNFRELRDALVKHSQKHRDLFNAIMEYFANVP
jgi:hypothetical protein